MPNEPDEDRIAVFDSLGSEIGFEIIDDTYKVYRKDEGVWVELQPIEENQIFELQQENERLAKELQGYEYENIDLERKRLTTELQQANERLETQTQHNVVLLSELQQAREEIGRLTKDQQQLHQQLEERDSEAVLLSEQHKFATDRWEEMQNLTQGLRCEAHAERGRILDLQQQLAQSQGEVVKYKSFAEDQDNLLAERDALQRRLDEATGLLKDIVEFFGKTHNMRVVKAAAAFLAAQRRTEEDEKIVVDIQE
jgi:chromosome segregation ATPase